MNSACLLLACTVLLSCSPLIAPVQPAGQPTDTSAILKEVNALRAKGCRCGNRAMPSASPLRWDKRLEEAALRHAQDMSANDFFDHRGSDGKKVGQRARDAGFQWRYIGENMAYNFPGAKAVVKGWQESPAHCKNMMSPDFEVMGAVYLDGYWVQVLGKD